MHYDLAILKRIEGIHKLEDLVGMLHITSASAQNLLTRLKREGYAMVWMKGKKRLYRISARKAFLYKENGMFTIINEHNPNFQVQEYYAHIVHHNQYGPEWALVDAIQTRSFRLTLGALSLFRSIKKWQFLLMLAKKHNVCQEVGAMYDVARQVMKVRAMPKHVYSELYHHREKGERKLSFAGIRSKEFMNVSQKWHVDVPYGMIDIKEVTA